MKRRIVEWLGVPSSWLIYPEWMKNESIAAELNSLWESIVHNRHIIHVFKSVSGDASEMAIAFPTLPALRSITNVVDIDVLAEALGCSAPLRLSLYVELYDGRPLDKREQCSIWDARPLTDGQRYYAATDAYVTRMLFFDMCKTLVAGEWEVEQTVNWEVARRRCLSSGMSDPPLRLTTDFSISTDVQNYINLYREICQ